MPNVRLRFAFNDWTRRGESIYSTEEGIELSLGAFHSGTVFEGSLDLDSDDAAELRGALESGAEPVFLVFAEVTP